MADTGTGGGGGGKRPRVAAMREDEEALKVARAALRKMFTLESPQEAENVGLQMFCDALPHLPEALLFLGTGDKAQGFLLGAFAEWDVDDEATGMPAEEDEEDYELAKESAEVVKRAMRDVERAREEKMPHMMKQWEWVRVLGEFVADSEILRGCGLVPAWLLPRDARTRTVDPRTQPPAVYRCTTELTDDALLAMAVYPDRRTSHLDTLLPEDRYNALWRPHDDVRAIMHDGHDAPTMIIIEGTDFA